MASFQIVREHMKTALVHKDMPPHERQQALDELNAQQQHRNALAKAQIQERRKKKEAEHARYLI